MKARIIAIFLLVFIVAAGCSACGKTDTDKRFVQDLNYLQFSSFSLQYEMPKNWISCLRMESLRFSFNMSDLFYWSTVKRERGTSYPFARSFTVGLRANF